MGKTMPQLIAGENEIECRVVIFDKDGTLVDQHLLLLELAKARRENVRRVAGEKAAKLWERSVGVDLKSEEIDNDGPLSIAPRREEVLVAASALYLAGLPLSEAKELAEKAYDEADDSMRPPYGSVMISGVMKVLRELKQVRLELAIASTDTRKRTIESFSVLGIASFFDVVVGGDDVTNGKPAPDMIFKILEKTALRPGEAVMVGDSVSDMQMGRKAGVKACIGVLTGSSSREKLETVADVVIPSVSELKVI